MPRTSSRFLRAALAATLAYAFTANTQVVPLGQQVDAILARYRKSIVLLADQAALAEEERERSLIVGRMLFEENREALSELTDKMLAAPARIPELLDIVEKRPDLRDADKLAFREVIDRLRNGLRKGRTAKLIARLEEDARALAEIRSLYDKELEKIFGQTQLRGIVVRREAWESYVSFVKSLYTREAILKEYDDALSSIAEGTRSITVARKASPLEITGSRLPKKTLVLTFDDGPDPLYTPAVLNILEKYKVRSIFFEVGKRAGQVKKDAQGKEKISPLASAESTLRLLANGHVLGNHSYSHALLTKLKDGSLQREIDLGRRILESVSKTEVTLFRPPYGGRNDHVLETLKERNTKAFIWNVDSLDWSDPVPKSIASRVVEQVEQQGRGVILMHDVHPQSVEALPLILDALQAKGYQFVLWDGVSFLGGTGPTRGEGAAPVASTAESLYRKSWAVVVGINEYDKWPKLSYAVNDAQAVKEVLVKKFLFPSEQVITLLDREATRERILSVLGDQLANSDKIHRDDRVFVFFAGHGITRKLASGRSAGYIVPVDGDTSRLQSTAISMATLQEVSEAIPAKHVFFVMDACYSGMALTRGAAPAGDPRKYLEEITRRAAREVLTAGGADEQVADNGPNGHSIFTWTLLQGMEGRADLNGDGFITASELGAYVGPAVSSLSRQTPAFGSLVGSEGGEFILELEHETEDLNEQSTQLDAEAIRLNTELERVRKAIAEKAARNERLASELAQAQAQLQATPEEVSKRQNDLGMKLYREKKYPEALAAFEEAARVNPKDAQAANNVGFLYFKLGNYNDALTWLLKTQALDAERPVTYVNLGDTYDKLNQHAKAAEAYQKYLQLMPDSPLAPKVKEKLAKLQ